MASVEVMKATPDQIETAWGVLLGDVELPAIEDPEVISRAIMERIRNAETFEDAFGPQDLAAWRELLDVPMRVHFFRLNRSTIEGAPPYAVVDVERLDGKDPNMVTVTCGGRNVLAQLVKALEMGWLDRPVKMIGRDTAGGFQALWLTAA